MAVASFEEWLDGASFYLQWDRYGNYTNGWVVVSNYDYDEALAEAVDNLEGGDIEMFEAVKVINRALEKGAWMGVGAIPSEALIDLESKMREYKERVLDPMFDDQKPGGPG